MAKETYDDEPMVEIMSDNDFSPLDAPVKSRPYTKPNIDESELMGDLEEPSFQRPSFSDIEPEEEVQEPERQFNPQFSELDNKEKGLGAEMMAELTLDLYEKGCGWLGKIPKISESKIDQMIVEGDIDSDMTLPTSAGDMPIKEFANEFNESIKEVFEVSDEFKEKVKPPLIRVFKKRGIGMTDEQLLAYYFITDLGTKGAQAFMLKKQVNSIYDALKENTIELRETRMRSDRPTNPTPTYATTSKDDEEVVEVFTEEVVKKPKAKRTKPKTNLEEQLDNFESDSVFDNLKGDSGFSKDFEENPSMPQFGDKSILAELDRLSGQENTAPRRKAGRGTAKRKPRK